ncbi:BBE domain-containing protein [Mangrovicoccus ximenensis]|uniref:BBE domain-containing protein n=1 Tax=Mangrovicoccus ximenensis TaxID=1911570 RepID=UPI001F225533|nr:BBE domain-containing protein [Mangrovicoccus ximenensis]
MPYAEVQRLFDARTPFGTRRCYWKARYLTELPDAMIDLAIGNAWSAPSPATISSLWNMGRAVRDVPAGETASGDRSMGWMYSVDGVWEDPAEDAANIDWARDAWAAAERFGRAGRAYLNFPGHGEDAALTRTAFGAGDDRLARVKAAYDAGNMFRFNQNILPAS